jgi:hypothetical protein
MEGTMSFSWRKSSHSGNGGGSCVDVARNITHVVAVRDSKDPHGPVLILTPGMWRDFIADLKAGRHDLVLSAPSLGY